MANVDRTGFILRGMARWLAAGAVILSAWLFGSAEGWSYLLICQVMAVAVMLWLFSLMTASQPRLRVPGLTVTLLLLVGFVALQGAPLPVGAVKELSPFSAGHQADSKAVLDRIVSGVGDQETDAGARATLSVCPGETTRSLFLLIAYVGTFLVMANAIRSWTQLRGVAVALVVSGFVMSLVGIIHKFSGSPSLLWFHEPRYGGHLFGPFSNPNHFAAHINLLIGVALGLYLSSSRIREALAWPNWQDRFAWLSTRRASGTALTAFAVGLMGGAMCMSLSRGGISSLIAAGGIVFGMVASFSSLRHKARSRLVAVIMLVGAAVVWLGWRPIVEEFLTLEQVVRNPVDDKRFVATARTLEIFGACPLFGSGFGSFRHVFPLFQSESLHFGRWLHAQNDWAQLLAEGGMVGAGLVLFALAQWAGYIVRHYAGIKARSELMILGLAVGFLAIAIHSFWDYSLHKPANMFLLAALAGLAIAAIHVGQPVLRPSDDAADGGQPPGEGGGANPWRWVYAHGVILAFVAALSGLLLLQEDCFRGDLAFARFLYAQKLADKTHGGPDFRKAVVQACAEADDTVAHSRTPPDALREITAGLFVWMFDRRLDTDVRLQLAVRAQRFAAMAVRAAPSDYLAWQWLGRVEAGIGRWDEADLSLDRTRELVVPTHDVRLFKMR